MIIPWLLLLATIDASSSTMNISQMESLLSQYDAVISSIMGQSTMVAPPPQVIIPTAPYPTVTLAPNYMAPPGPYATQTHFTGHLLAPEGATAIKDIEFDAVIDNNTISTARFSTLTQIPIYQTATVTATQTVTQTPTGNFYQNIGMLDNDSRSESIQKHKKGKSRKLKKKKRSKQKDSEQDSDNSDCDSKDQKIKPKIKKVNKQKLKRFGDDDGFSPDFRIDDIEIELINFDKETEADKKKLREKRVNKQKKLKHKKRKTIRKQKKRQDLKESIKDQDLDEKQAERKDRKEKRVRHTAKKENIKSHKAKKEKVISHEAKKEKVISHKVKEEPCIKAKTEIIHLRKAAKPTPTGCCVQFAETRVKTVTHVSVIPIHHTDYRVYTDRVIVPKTEILTRVEYAPYRVTKTITDTMYMMRPTSGGGCGCELAANGMILPANQLPPGIYATPVDKVDRSRYEIIGFAGHDAVNNLRPL